MKPARGEVPPNLRMHLTGYSGLRPLPSAGDAGRWVEKGDQFGSRGNRQCLTCGF